MIDKIEFPSDFIPKGLIKIELFDDLTKKKVEEINTHNFIARGVLDHLFKAKMRDVFTQGRNTGGRSVSTSFGDMFEQMSLTDANHPESPETEWLRKGKVIGYALTTTTYSGSSTIQGTYNAVESSTTAEKVHMVFDFPTNAANGTFQSIYFHQSSYVQPNNYYRFPKIGDGVYSLKKYNDQFYVLKSSTLEVYNSNWNLLNSYDLKDYSIRDFEIVDDYLFYVKDSTTNTIRKAPIANPTALELVIERISDYCGGIAFNDINRQFIIGNYLSANNIQFMYYDVNFNLINTITKSIDSLSYSNGKLTIIDGDLIAGPYYIDTRGDAFKVSSYDVRGAIDGLLYASAGFLLPKLAIGSRALLDAPVTKLNTQTMKITYDFILPPLF
ncbi:hypothetical protein [Heyndrickxia coagulans]|uniref:hypothetical protein n=1 Tax=Heyndrickxia coagulans TaxID=1398 RepID=UPI003D1CE0F3